MSTALLRLTLFTKTNCGLCTTAKEALTRVQSKIPFQLDQIDIYAPGQEAAQKYMFDVPVVELNGRVAMMHRIDEPKLIDILHNAQKSDSQQKK
ncbi:thioredoxin-like protein [Linnemannia elongata]|nr:thioredoxin-like protein [Linnemannia elongata]